MSSDKKPITTCHLTFIIKIALKCSYFRFISIGFKQNLESECSKFYFRSQKKF